MSRLDDAIKRLRLDSGSSGFGGSSSPNLLNLARGGNPDPFLNTVALNRDLGVLANLPTNTVTQHTGPPPKITQFPNTIEFTILH